jgi:hypothetical protein
MATETETERRQINLSLDKEAEDMVSRLLPIVSKTLGVKVTRSSLFPGPRVFQVQEDTAMSDAPTDPEIDLANATRWAIREAIARTNADPSSVDEETWKTAYVKHFEESRREAGLLS